MDKYTLNITNEYNQTRKVKLGNISQNNTKYEYGYVIHRSSSLGSTQCSVLSIPAALIYRMM